MMKSLFERMSEAQRLSPPDHGEVSEPPLKSEGAATAGVGHAPALGLREGSETLDQAALEAAGNLVGDMCLADPGVSIGVTTEAAIKKYLDSLTPLAISGDQGLAADLRAMADEVAKEDDDLLKHISETMRYAAERINALATPSPQRAAQPAVSDETVERVARALYEHWVAENLEDDWAGWERLGDKQTWYDRADAAIAALEGEKP